MESELDLIFAFTFGYVCVLEACSTIQLLYTSICYNISTLLIASPQELTCTASANKSTPFNMAARPSTPNRISFPVAIPRRDTLDRVDWMAERRRLREVLLSVFMIAIMSVGYGCLVELLFLFGLVGSMQEWKMEWTERGAEVRRGVFGAPLRRSKSFSLKGVPILPNSAKHNMS